MKDKAQRDQSMFGCSTADLDQMTEDYKYIDEFNMLAMSILSDSQEEMERGNFETARQYINKAKYVMGKHHSKLRNLTISG
jgi:hypothetical protein